MHSASITEEHAAPMNCEVNSYPSDFVLGSTDVPEHRVKAPHVQLAPQQDTDDSRAADW
jgi:hypothetical protein